MYCSAAEMDSIRSAALIVVDMVRTTVMKGLAFIIPDAAEAVPPRFRATCNAWGHASATLRTCTKSAQAG